MCSDKFANKFTYYFSFFLLLCCFSIPASSSAIIKKPSSSTSINGQRLHVLPSHIEPHVNVTRNSSDQIVNVTGSSIEILKLISKRLNFTFEYYQEVSESDMSLSTLSSQPSTAAAAGGIPAGKIGFFSQNESIDILVGSFGFTAPRYRLVDYPYPVTLTQMALMIPKPTINTRTNYIAAILEPFQLQVWLFITFSMLLGVVVLYGIFYFLTQINRHQQQSKIAAAENRFEKALAVIFGNILVQGSLSSRALENHRNLVIRFFVGAWSISCFVLVTAYSSVLISFLTAPADTFIPLVNSVNDLLNKTNVRVTVNKGLIADTLIKGTANNKKDGNDDDDDDNTALILRYINKELDQNPDQRCVTTDQCVEQVRRGSSVFIRADSVIFNVIGEDWKKTGRCDFTVAKEKFLLTLTSGFLLQKNSPYTKEFSIELMWLEAAGLLQYWKDQYTTDPHHCLRKIEMEMNDKTGAVGGVGDEKKSALNLNGISGSLVILGVGYILALTSFIGELAFRRCRFSTLCAT